MQHRYSTIFFTSLLVVLLMMSIECKAQHTDVSDTINRKRIKMTSLAFGGTGVLFTSINNQLGVMTGGRGSATFNHRYTFGGAGWGMPKGIEIESYREDTFEFFKFGYGGLEFGYIFFEGKKFRFGTNMLTALGIGFQESIPKAKGEVGMFPVFEPSVYSQLTWENC